MGWKKKPEHTVVIVGLLVFFVLSLIWPWVYVAALLGCGLLVLMFHFTGTPLVPFFRNNPKIGVVFAAIFGSVFAALSLIYNPLRLFEAWNTGLIVSLRGKAPDITYIISENPVGFWFVFAGHLVAEIAFLMLLFVSVGFVFLYFSGMRFDQFFEKYRRFDIAFFSLIGLVVGAIVFFVMPFGLLEAWTSGVIVDVRRRLPDLVYVFSKNPAGYWFVFAKYAFMNASAVLLLSGFAYVLWSVRKLPAQPKKRYRFLTRPSPPMEPTADDAARYRRTINSENFKQL